MDNVRDPYNFKLEQSSTIMCKIFVYYVDGSASFSRFYFLFIFFFLLQSGIYYSTQYLYVEYNKCRHFMYI